MKHHSIDTPLNQTTYERRAMQVYCCDFSLVFEMGLCRQNLFAGVVFHVHNAVLLDHLDRHALEING